MDFHPLAEKFPLMEGDEFEALKASIHQTGGINDDPVKYRLVKGKKQGLDGRNRLNACESLGLKPAFKLVAVMDVEVKDFIFRHNVIRRHLTKEFRKELAKELNGDGHTIRGIADTLGVSVGTVHNDLSDNSSPAGGNCSELNTAPTGDENTQKDGEKEQSATRTGGDSARDEPVAHSAIRAYIEAHPGCSNAEVHRELKVSEHVVAKVRKTMKPPPILCERCARVGAIAGCGMCAEARKGKGGKKKPKKKSQQEEVVVKDDFGNDVPKRCRDIWCDPWLSKTFDFLAVMLEKFLAERIADGMHQRRKRLTMFNHKDFTDGAGFIGQYLDQLIQHLKDRRPAGVCPSCQGNGCPTCNLVGLLSRTDYLKLKKEAS